MGTEVARGGAVLVPVARRRLRSRLPLRLRVMIHKVDLDRELASGADPSSSDLLALRGAQLTGARSRRRLADGLERLIAPHPRPAYLSSVARPRADLRRSRAVLLGLRG